MKVRAASFHDKMAKLIEKLGSAKRFGPRYGSKPKHTFAKIEKEQRKLHKCPYCNAEKVKRIVMGIWHCRKCNAEFTGKAYSISKTFALSEKPELEQKEAEEAQEPEEEEENIEEAA